MDKPKPPKITPVPTDVLLDRGIAAPLLQTWLRILALAWRNDYKRTEWLPLDALLGALGNGKVDRATFLRHAGALKALKLLDWDTDGKNRYRFSIVQVRLHEVAMSHFCDPSSSGSSILLSQDKDPLQPPDESQKCDLSQNRDFEGVLDPDSYMALRQIGIGERTAVELSNIPTVTAWYIKAMAAQARRDGVNTGALIYRIREQWGAPEWCEQCGGLDGEHAESCPTQAGKQRLPDEWSDVARLAAEREDTTETEPPMSTEMQEAADLWGRALDELQLQLTSAAYNTWLGRAHVVGRENGTLVVGVHNGYAKDWLENRMSGMVNRTLTGLAGRDLHVRFVVYGPGGAGG